MKKVLIASGIAALAFASMVSAQGYMFSTNLTVGSTGPDVVALQTWLIANGYSIPSIASGAAAKGYFGSQTKAAVTAYQAAHGIPNTGFFGPLTRASLSSGSTVTTSTGATQPCPAGYMCTPVGNTTTTGSNGTTVAGPTGITTPGVPGIMSVTSGPLSSTVLNVGAQMVPVLAIRVQAQYSDLAVQSLNLDLGNNTAVYNKLFNKVYVTNGTSVLASQSLNSSTVIQSGNNYIVGLAGFNFIVPKGTYKDIIIKADLNSSIDSAYLAGGANFPDGTHAAINNVGGTNVSGWAIGLDANQLRAVDGAGINLNNAGNLTAQVLTINKSLVDNAQANLSVDGTSPQTNAVPVSDTTNGNYLGLPVLVFDVYAQNDTLHLHNLAVNFTTSLGGGNTTGQITAAYLFQGSTQIQSASITGNVATFSNITDGTNGASIPVNTTVPFTVKVDVTGVSSGSMNITASTSVTNTTIYNSIDGNVTTSGSAAGNTLTVLGVGPSITLASAPTIATTGTNNTGNTLSTSTITASFPINIYAVGTDVYFGTQASTSVSAGPSFLFNVQDSTGATVYSGYGTATGIISNSANLNNVKAVLPTLPTQVTNGVTQANSFKVANQNTVNLGTITFQFDGKSINGQTLSGGPYKVNLAAVRYVTSSGIATSTFMSGLQAWTTPGANP